MEALARELADDAQQVVGGRMQRHLAAAHGGQDDACTQVAKDLPTVRAATSNIDDANTMYAEHLS